MPPLYPVILTTLERASTAPEGIGAARKATMMFTLVALGLGALLLLALLVVVIRRVRQRQATAAKPTGVLVDPWSEAARRVRPFDSQDRAE